MRWSPGLVLAACLLAIPASADDNDCAEASASYQDCQSCAVSTSECEPLDCEDSPSPCEGGSFQCAAIAAYRAQLAHCMVEFCSGWPSCSGLGEGCPLCACTPGYTGWGCLEWDTQPESPSTCKNTTSSIKSCVACSIVSFCSFIGFIVYCEIDGFDDSMDRCMDKCGVASTCDWDYCDCSQFTR